MLRKSQGKKFAIAISKIAISVHSVLGPGKGNLGHLKVKFLGNLVSLFLTTFGMPEKGGVGKTGGGGALYGGFGGLQ